MKFRGLIVSTFASLLLACGPLVMVPGGALSGSVVPVPADWSFSDAIETIQLETRPSDPYSVNLWGIGIGKNFYVATSSAGSRWATHVSEDPRVRLKLGDDLYELIATRTKDSAELDAFLAALKTKYDHEPERAKDFEEATLFRLEARR
ncbi:MAG: hypothetical protein VCB25_07995 [Myxococcota bacterium]